MTAKKVTVKSPAKTSTKKKRELSRGKYDLLAVPLSIFNWTEEGVLWNSKATGTNDMKIRARFESLCKHYEPVPISIEGNVVYFFFRKK